MKKDGINYSMKNNAWASIRTAEFGMSIRSAFKHRSTFFLTTGMLAVGIGIVAVVYSLAAQIILDPFPGWTQPQGLVAAQFQKGNGYIPISLPDTEELTDRVYAFDNAAGAISKTAHLAASAGALPRLVKCELVTPDYFSVVGVSAVLGSPEIRSGPTAIISHRLWQDFFSGREDVLGNSMLLNGTAITLSGVAARGFQGSIYGSESDLWLHAAQLPVLEPFMPAGLVETGRVKPFFSVLARMGQDIAPQAAQAELDAYLSRALASGESGEAVRSVIYDDIAHNPARRSRLQTMFGALGAAAVLLLVISVANAAMVCLSRNLARREEFAVRTALGATRFRLLLQAAYEAVLIGAASAIGAVAVAWASGRLLGAVRLGDDLPVLPAGDLGWGTILLIALASVAAALAIAIPTRWVLTGSGESLGGSSVRHTRSGEAKVTGVFLTLQIAASVTLAIGALLFLGTVYNYSQVDHGLSPRNVLTVAVEPGRIEKTPEGILRAYQELYTGLEDGPGVVHHSIAEITPFEQTLRPVTLRVRDGDEPQSPRKAGVLRNFIAGEYFETLGIEVQEGRPFRTSEALRAPENSVKVGIVNRSTAEQLWPAGSALGRVVYVEESQQELRIVGIVGDHQISDIGQRSSRVLYEPLAQASFPPPKASLVMKTNQGLSSVAPFVRRQLRVTVPGLAAQEVQFLRDRMNKLLAEERLLAQVTGLVGAAALFLSCAALFATMVSSVRRRSYEIGIRVTLGASARRIGWLVCSRTVLIFLIGSGLGVLLSYWLSGFVEGKFYGISALDPQVYVATISLMAVPIGLAAYLPVRRALNLDPARTLRSE